ncbi:MAG: PLP-dependent transferase [Chitinophagaceae bacterium]|nr:PLP-dependent transferase [Oligoflexus sp.]
MGNNFSPETLCNHPEFHPLPADNHPLTPPIYQSVKFTVDDFGELKKIFRGEREGYFYSRASNPTLVVLERLLAQLQGTEGGRTLASGVAAITHTLLTLLKSGDRLIYFLESYGPSRAFAEVMLAKFGVEIVKLSLDDRDGIKRELAMPRTKAVLFESVTNPQLKVAPLALIHQEAKKHGVLTILDNTFAGFQSWDSWRFDLYIHSLTKYASGHGDVMGGAILGSEQLLKSMDRDLHNLGSTLDPHAAYLIQRGLKTYHLRRRAQVENSQILAEWLEKHPAVDHVVYPGLKSHPEHEWFTKHFDDTGSIIFLSLKNKQRDIEKVVTRGKLFMMTGSLGSTESLITPALFFYASDLTPEERTRAGIDPSSMRLSIGIENPKDLLADLQLILSE